MTKITGTNTYIDVELDGRTARIAGEMIVGGFVCYKSSMKNWLVPENEPLTEDDKKEIIQKVTEKTAGSHRQHQWVCTDTIDKNLLAQRIGATPEAAAF